MEPHTMCALLPSVHSSDVFTLIAPSVEVWSTKTLPLLRSGHLCVAAGHLLHDHPRTGRHWLVDLMPDL